MTGISLLDPSILLHAVDRLRSLRERDHPMIVRPDSWGMNAVAVPAPNIIDAADIEVTQERQERLEEWWRQVELMEETDAG